MLQQPRLYLWQVSITMIAKELPASMMDLQKGIKKLVMIIMMEKVAELSAGVFGDVF